MAKRKTLASRRELIKLSRLFLLWFEQDGTPVDGFRFRSQHRQLSEAVNFEEWRHKLMHHKPKRKARTDGK